MPMRRREFISGLAGVSAWPVAARAQQPDRVRRIGILMPYLKSDAAVQARLLAFRQELERLGEFESRNVQFDERWATDNMDSVRAEAASLVGLNPDAIIVNGDRVIPILMKLTRSIPIVVVGTSDPIASGAAESLARPGRNVTGFSVIEFSVFGKMLETLKRIVPGISRAGMMYNPDNPVGPTFWRSFDPIAKQLAVQPIDMPIHDPAEIERAIAKLATLSNGGVLLAPDLTTLSLRPQVLAIVARYRIPAIYSDRAFATDGGLVSYGADRLEPYRQAASYVDRILHGEKAGDLPFQQPTKYQLVINLKTAKVLGLAVPEALLATADEVIQ
jgi:putative tryptophan/tyrosine transport system substrate-binding protein